MKLDVGRFSLAAAILWGAGVFCLGIVGHFGWATKVVDVLSSGYVGYSTTFLGSLIGGIWGFFDGFVGAALFAWLYNRLPAARASS
jgi:hypothetical protein